MLTLDHVQIAAPAGCEAEGRRFFSGLLGLEEISKKGSTTSSGGLWFRTASVELHIGVDTSFSPARKAHVALSVPSMDGLEVVAEQLKAAGYPLLWDERLPGICRFFTTDPWGNRLELMHRLDLSS